MSTLELIKEQILQALSHPEGEDGLYFSNLYILHEEDERPRVSGSPIDIGKAVEQLLAERKVKVDDSGEEAIICLSGTA